MGRPTLALGPDEPDDLDESSAPSADATDAAAPRGESKTRSDSLLARLKKLEPGRLRAPGPDPDDPDEREEHDEALEQALDDELLTIADEVAGAVAGSVEPAQEPEPEPKPEPDPKPDTQPEPEPEPKQDTQPEPDPEPKQDPQPEPTPTQDLEPEPEPEPKQDPQPGPDPKPKPKSAPEPEPKPPPTPQRAPLTEADKTGPWPIRVDDVAYDPVDEEGLATLLRSGVWLDVIELGLDDDRWMSLEQHPAYPRVRRRLLRRTQQIVEQVATGEFIRDGGDDARSGDDARISEPAPPEPAPVQPQDRPGDKEPDAGPRQAADHGPQERIKSVEDSPAPAERPAWHYRLFVALSVVAGLTIGAALAAAASDWLDAESSSAGPRTEAGDISSEDIPVLTIPPTSEPTQQDWRDAIERAREQLVVAHREDTFAAALTGEQRYSLARDILLEAMVRRGVKPHLKRAFNRALAADPALEQEVVTLGVDETVDGIHALGGGRSVSLRMTKAGKNVYAFKPAQDEWNNGWRAEVAAYVFCEFVPCHFEVPKNRPARISRADFEELYGGIEGDWQASYAERFDALHWVEEAGPDGKEREYLYGTLKDWVPHFIDWPIEYTDVWKEWLDVRFHPDNLNAPYKEALAPLEERADGKFYRDALAEQGDATLRDVARGLSAILVFDYLTHNWDRFSTTSDYYGVNNQFADGRFISLDNGAAFYDRTVPEVEPRIELTTRFSHRMITAVRALSAETVDELLFPDPNWNERTRLKIFWKQRQKLLQRVDELVAHYGEERVFEFR